MKKNRITILGSGTCVPVLSRMSSSVLFETAVSETICLVDTGSGCMRRLMETGTSVFDVSYIFYTHLHPDHTGELASILFSLKYSEIDQEKKKLTIVAAKGFKEFYNKLSVAYGRWIEVDSSLLNIIELDNEKEDTVSFSDFKVQSMPVDHSDQSIAYRITTSDEKTIVFSGDSDFCEGLRAISHQADLLICECSHPDALKRKGHMTPSLAARIANRSEVKKLVLTHFYPECDSIDIKKQCWAIYKGEIILAEDLMTILL